MIQASLNTSMTMPINTGPDNRPPPPAKNENPLTDEQAMLVNETLSEFDVHTLTESNAQSIVATFSQAGIEPGKALETAMKEAGFDAKSLGHLAGVEPQVNHLEAGATGQVSLTSQMLDFLSEQLDKYSDNELTDENKALIMTAMQEEFGLETINNLLDVQV